MATVFKTTVFYPDTRPHEGDPELVSLLERISALSGSYISGPEVTDLGPGTGGFTTIRRWASNEVAQRFIDDVNETIVSYTKTTSIDQEVI
jgi:hypothetical protein